MKTQIRPDHLKLVLEILREYLPEYEVWAFGSRVKGKVKPYSDLDLVIISQQPVPVRRMALMEDAFEESDLPFRVDLVDWAETSDAFRRIVLEAYEVIQNKSESGHRAA